MKRLQRAAILTKLAHKLHDEGSWCGKTHLQKATYFLNDLLGVSLYEDFTLYKHGPFSFKMKSEIAGFHADGLFELKLRERRYGPSIYPTERAENLWQHFPQTLNLYEPQIEFVAKQLGPCGVVELEQLGTALYVTLSRKSGESVKERAVELCRLKPHLSKETACDAVQKVDDIIANSVPCECDLLPV